MKDKCEVGLSVHPCRGGMRSHARNSATVAEVDSRWWHPKNQPTDPELSACSNNEEHRKTRTAMKRFKPSKNFRHIHTASKASCFYNIVWSHCFMDSAAAPAAFLWSGMAVFFPRSSAHWVCAIATKKNKQHHYNKRRRKRRRGRRRRRRRRRKKKKTRQKSWADSMPLKVVLVRSLLRKLSFLKCWIAAEQVIMHMVEAGVWVHLGFWTWQSTNGNRELPWRLRFDIFSKDIITTKLR